MINTRLGAWLIEKELARGEIGTVYLASRPASDHVSATQAAIKIAHPEADVSQRLRLRREAEVLAQLQHPHIVRIFEAGDYEGRPFYVMEYVDASDLQKVLARQGRIPWHQAVEVLQQVCQALKYCHDRGVVHGNIKLSHLLCGTAMNGQTPRPLVKVIDFGLAWVFGANHPSPPRSYAGNPGELSPEQIDGQPATRRSDVFALGAVLWSLVTGKSFAAQVETLAQERYANIQPAGSLVSDLPEALDALLAECLSVDPAARPADAGVLLRRLDGLRRKSDRKSAAAEAATSPISPEAEATPAELMSRLMREELERQRNGGPWQQLFSHPLVIVPLFLLTLGVLVWTFWPASADTLFRKGDALMQSDDPNDWEKAWSDYLGPLQDRHPDHPFQQQVKEHERKLQAHRAGREAVCRARQVGPTTDPERFYRKGLEYRQLGQEEKARQVWQQLIDVFEHVPSEKAWVDLARQDLADPSAHTLPQDHRLAPARVAVEKLKKLQREGKEQEANGMREAYRALYANDLAALELLRQADAAP